MRVDGETVAVTMRTPGSDADLALGSTDVPYGWPLYIRDFLPAKEWTDLTLSFVLQAGNLMQTDQLLAGVVMLSLFGLAVGKLIDWLEARLLHWR